MQNFTLFAHGLAGAARWADRTAKVLSSTMSRTSGAPRSRPVAVWTTTFRSSITVSRFGFSRLTISTSMRTSAPTSASHAGVLGGRANLSGVDLSTGIVTHFGHIIPPPPITYTCAVSPTTAFPATRHGDRYRAQRDPEEDRDLLPGPRRAAPISGTSSTCQHRHQGPCGLAPTP